MAVGTTQVNQVLTTWANNFVEDVPAVHKEGKYYIEYHELVKHLNTLEFEQLVDIMLKVAAEHSDKN